MVASMLVLLLVLLYAIDAVGAFRTVSHASLGRRLRRPVNQAYRERGLSRRRRCLLGAGSGGDGGNDDARVVRQAKAWVRDVVVKLRLCPFAEAVFNRKTGVRYVVTHAETADGLWRDFVREVDHLAGHDREEVGTTLLIAPRCLGDVQDFNDFCAWLEETIENDETLVDQVLVACFHPKHAFQGLEEDDVLNYEKRSPHPTINLLRVDMVDEYIALGKTLGIAEHNERRLHKEGKDAVKAAFEATLALQ